MENFVLYDVTGYRNRTERKMNLGLPISYMVERSGYFVRQDTHM